MIFRAAPSTRHRITAFASSVFSMWNSLARSVYILQQKSRKLNGNFCRTGTQCILKRDFFFASQRRSCVWPHFLFQCVQAKAREAGLWNLFLPSASGLSQLDYAFIAEETGRVAFAPEVFNCQAPGETSHTSGSFQVLSLSLVLKDCKKNK